jgi:hypothetical protein
MSFSRHATVQLSTASDTESVRTTWRSKWPIAYPEVIVRAFLKGVRQRNTLRCLNCCFQLWLFLHGFNFPSLLYRERSCLICLLNTLTHCAHSRKNAEMNKGLAFVWSHLCRGPVNRNQEVSGSSLSPETGSSQLFPSFFSVSRSK